MVMSEGQDPGVLMNEVNHLRGNQLVFMGEVINDDSILGIVLERLTDDCVQIKYCAETVIDLSLDQAVITMRNMSANSVMRNGPSRKAKGRESAMATYL